MWIDPRKHKVVGEKLAAARTAADMTQVELARILKKPQSFVSSYESGQRRIDLLEFAVIVRAIGGDPSRIANEILGELSPQAGGPKRKTKS